MKTVFMHKAGNYQLICNYCFDLIANPAPTEKKKKLFGLCAVVGLSSSFSLCLSMTEQIVPAVRMWENLRS